MIGVLAEDSEHAVVREFFELFKTPWEFCRDDRQYDVVICSGDRFPSSSNVVLIYGSSPQTFDQKQGIRHTSVAAEAFLVHRNQQVPIYGGRLGFDGSSAAFVKHAGVSGPMVVGGDLGELKWARLGYDLFQEVRHLLTRGQPVTNAATPTLELHIAVVRDLITACGISLIEIPPVPLGYPLITCLTHDVDHVGIRNHKWDHTMMGFLYRATFGSALHFCQGRKSLKQVAKNWLAVLSLPFVHLGLAEDFWIQFEHYRRIEDGLTSTFFVIPRKGDPGQDSQGRRLTRRAAKYEVGDISEDLRRLRRAGHEVGVHGIDAWRDTAAGLSERKRIAEVVGDSDLGVRMHWLYFGEDSPSVLEQAGFSYDSTGGYNETIGYRAGTTQAFKPLDAQKLLELPMHVMDTAMFYPSYMDIPDKEARAVLKPLVQNAVQYGGVLTINWHDRSIAPERLWDECYVALLEDLKTRRAWFTTAARAVSWFRLRRSAVFEEVSGPRRTFRIKASFGSATDLPGLRVRIHRSQFAPAMPLNNSAVSEPYRDMAFNDEMEISLAN